MGLHLKSTQILVVACTSVLLLLLLPPPSDDALRLKFGVGWLIGKMPSIGGRGTFFGLQAKGEKALISDDCSCLHGLFLVLWPHASNALNWCMKMCEIACLLVCFWASLAWFVAPSFNTHPITSASSNQCSRSRNFLASTRQTSSSSSHLTGPLDSAHKMKKHSAAASTKVVACLQFS